MPVHNSLAPLSSEVPACHSCIVRRYRSPRDTSKTGWNSNIPLLNLKTLDSTMSVKEHFLQFVYAS